MAKTAAAPAKAAAAPTKPKPNPKRAKAAPKANGRPPYVPTEQNRKLVMVLRANGIDPADIAREVGCVERTLYKYYAPELEHGLATIRANIGGVIVQQALKGNLTAAIFWMKTHGGPGWTVPTANVEVTGDGAGSFKVIIQGDDAALL